MSVLVTNRSLSKLEVFNNAVDLRKKITLFLLKDFGLKEKIRETSIMTKNMTEEDKKLFMSIVDKYNCTYVLDEYPQWLVNKSRTIIYNELTSLVHNITSANSIYPTFVFEYETRRSYQTNAILCCERIYQELQFIMDIIPVNANKFMPYVELLDKEDAYLRKWRKSDNRLLKAIKSREEKGKMKKDAVKDDINNKQKDKKSDEEPVNDAEATNQEQIIEGVNKK